MKLYFKQRFFSWFDSYDIYYEGGDVAYTVEGKLSWGHCLHILDPYGEHIATVKQQVLTFLPKFDLYVGERCIGTIRKDEKIAEDDRREVRDVVDIGFTLDERIADGFYFARSLKIVQHLLAHPELLELPLNQEVTL